MNNTLCNGSCVWKLRVRDVMRSYRNREFVAVRKVFETEKKKIQNSLCPCIGRRACFNHSLRRMVAGTSCRLQIGIFATQPYNWHYKRTSNSITNLHRFRSIRDERLKSPMHIRPRRRRLMRQTLPICTYSIPLVRCSNNRLSRCYYIRYQYLIIPFRLKIRHNVQTTATGNIVL